MHFHEVIGQMRAKEYLLSLLRMRRMPHALLLSEREGSGAMPLALALASTLLGEHDDGSTPEISAMLRKWQHPDLHFAFPVIRPKNTSSDKKITSDDFFREWCHMLQESPYFTHDHWLELMKTDNQQSQLPAAEADKIAYKLSFKAHQGGNKVCIIWLPERMHTACANKLLKLFEEPPENTYFLLVSEAPEELLATISSRMQRIDIPPIATDDVALALTDRCGLAHDQAYVIAQHTHGSWTEVMKELSNSDERNTMHNMYVTLMRNAYQRKVKELKGWSEKVAAIGREKQRNLLEYFAEYTRQNLLYNHHNDLAAMTPYELAFARNFARYINDRNARRIATLFNNVDAAIAQNANAKMQFFDLALTIMILLRT